MVFVLALALTFFLGALGPKWVGWIALVAGILGLVGSSAAYLPDTNGKPFGLTILGFVALIGLLLSILITCITMLRTAGCCRLSFFCEGASTSRERPPAHPSVTSLEEGEVVHDRVLRGALRQPA